LIFCGYEETTDTVVATSHTNTLSRTIQSYKPRFKTVDETYCAKQGRFEEEQVLVITTITTFQRISTSKSKKNRNGKLSVWPNGGDVVDGKI
jgi:hypothetical protein